MGAIYVKESRNSWLNFQTQTLSKHESENTKKENTRCEYVDNSNEHEDIDHKNMCWSVSFRSSTLDGTYEPS